MLFSFLNFFLLSGYVQMISTSHLNNIIKNSTITNRRLIEWGQSVPWKLNSNNIKCDCTFKSYPICCSAIKVKIATDIFALPVKEVTSECIIKRKYIPSKYELIHYQKSVEISNLVDFNERRNRTLAFLFSDAEIEASVRWLVRVKLRMTGGYHEPTKDDMNYLSHYKVTKHCQVAPDKSAIVKHWIEWIEPLTMHARHPFSVFTCMVEICSYEKFTVIPPRSDFDYSKLGFAKQVIAAITSVNLINTDHILLKQRDISMQHSRKYMFDAGTSTFNSSLSWFTCAYDQANIVFDRIYGWELTLLEPTEFWNMVPPRYLSDYTFFNR